LTWEYNQGYIVKIKAALKAGIRPVAMLFREQPSAPWTDFDFLLVEAFQILEDETCNQCGNPIWICRNEDASNVGFKVKKSVCFATAELERWQAQQEKAGAKQKPGETPYAMAYTYDGSPMPTREEFYKSLSDTIE
jgi:hypothetical protein